MGGSSGAMAMTKGPALTELKLAHLYSGHRVPSSSGVETL